MAEESFSSSNPPNPPNPPGPGDETLRRLERRIEYLEHAIQQENKWWRGGLIATLIFLALAILIAGHHRNRRPPMGMMAGCRGMRMMPYGPPPPPDWGYGQGGGWGPPPHGWRYHQWNGPGSDGPPPPPKG